jgi:predicted transcriptional regulator YheO
MKLDLKRNGDFKIYKLKKNDDKYSDEVTGHVNSTVKSPIGDIEVKATPYLSKMEDDEVTITVTRTEPMAVVDRLKKRSLNMVVSSRDASIIEIKCKDVSKQRATDIINAVIAEYRKESDEDKDAQAAVSEKYVTERLASLENELKTLDYRVADYKSKTMMPDLEVMAKAYAEGAKDISQALLEVSAQLNVVQAIRDYLRDESKKDELLPALLIIGMASMITFEALFHMAINTGVFPVSGQPLPFISKGGTSILVNSIAIGVMLSVSRTIANTDNGKNKDDGIALPSGLDARNPSEIPVKNEWK